MPRPTRINFSSKGDGAAASQELTSWRRSLLFVGAGVFATSVTIASIPTPDRSLAPHLTAFPPSSPPHTVVYSDDVSLTESADAELLAELLKAATVGRHATGPESPESYVEVQVRPGDSLARILSGRGIDAPELLQLVGARPDARPLNRLIPGQRLLLRTDAAGHLQELVHSVEPYESLRLTRAATGFEVLRERREYEVRIAYVAGNIMRSLFQDAQEAGLPEPLILGLAEIFGWDIDFALDLRAGDRFAVVHEEKYWLGQKVADGEILAAEFVNRGKTYRAIGYRHEDGTLHYYTPEGKSLRRAFLRAPVKFSRVSSTFSDNRYHPILKISRAHKGVDYAAPAGTPVHATASGRIVSLGWNGGYGKAVVIRHGGAYSTLYAHLSRIRPGLKVGQHVEQGATIGYVGQTGLATGPHLHYEFQVNGAHRNPLTYEFPVADPVAAPLREAFYRAARQWSAQLDVISGAHQLARSGT